jgi:hypothetical protein
MGSRRKVVVETSGLEVGVANGASLLLSEREAMATFFMDHDGSNEQRAVEKGSTGRMDPGPNGIPGRKQAPLHGQRNRQGGSQR